MRDVIYPGSDRRPRRVDVEPPPPFEDAPPTWKTGEGPPAPSPAELNARLDGAFALDGVPRESEVDCEG